MTGGVDDGGGGGGGYHGKVRLVWDGVFTVEGCGSFV